MSEYHTSPEKTLNKIADLWYNVVRHCTGPEQSGVAICQGTMGGSTWYNVVKHCTGEKQIMGKFKTITDDTLRETIPHGNEAYPFAYYLEDVWQFDFHCLDWHWHYELEFMYVAKGTIFCYVGAEKIELKEGCGIFVNSGILHRYTAAESCLIPNIVFSPALLAPKQSTVFEKYVSPVIKSLVPYQVFSPQVPWQRQLLENLNKIFDLQEREERNELRTTQHLLQMWDILFSHMDLSAASSAAVLLNRQQISLQAMMQYIHDHYAEKITLEEIAASASVSKSNALRLFHSCIHVSPVAYLIQYRLTKAAELLCTTEKTISVIAEESGFIGAGYFCRKFREYYQMTPKEYRKKEVGRQNQG